MDVNSLEWRHGLQVAVLQWFDLFRRDYPWRNSTDAYQILLAEKLLQQTKANDLVVRAYEQIINKYPTTFDLALANLEDLTRIVKPLGLTFRANHILVMARQVVELYNGKIPENYQLLMNLMGVGEYCAKAVLSFGYHQDIAVVDTNVGRFLFRLFNIQRKFPANPSRKKYLIEKAQYLLPQGNSKSFNLAILDLCAFICKPKTPRCNECPVLDYCQFSGKKI